MKREARRGMALLTVLLLVAVMAVICVLVLDDVRFAVRRATNIELQAELQGQAAVAETAARLMLAQRLKPGTAVPFYLDPGGQSLSLDTDVGTVSTHVRDGQSCFNLNSLVLGQGEDLRPRPQATVQLIELGMVLGIGRPTMTSLASALTDWMDSDQDVTSPGGAEDASYATGRTPYRTAGLMLADVSEIRAVRGMTPALYARLRPFVCALPEARPSQLNLNALGPAQAPLLVGISGGQMTLGAARAALTARPVQGWSSPDAFWAQSVLNQVVADDELRRQTVLTSRYYNLRIEVVAGDDRAIRTALIHVPLQGEVRTVLRRWTPEE